MAKKWSEVESNPEYQKLDSTAREDVRNEYFANVVMPNVPAEDMDSVRTQFDKDTAPTAWSSVKDFFTIGDKTASIGKGSGSLVGGIGAMAETPVTTVELGLSKLAQGGIGLLINNDQRYVMPGDLKPSTKRLDHATGRMVDDNEKLAAEINANLKIKNPMDNIVDYWAQRNAEEQKTAHKVGTEIKEIGKVAHDFYDEKVSPETKAAQKVISNSEGATGWVAAVMQYPDAFAISLLESAPGMAAMFAPGMGLNKAAQIFAPLTKAGVREGHLAAAKAIAGGATEAQAAQAGKQAIADFGGKAVEKHIGAVSMAGEGSQSYGSSLQQAQERIDGIKEGDLVNISPRYRDLLKSHSPEEARAMLKGETGAFNGIIGMIGNIFAAKMLGGGQAKADVIQSKIASGKLLVKNIDKEGKEEAAQSMLEGVGQYQEDLIIDPNNAKYDATKLAASGYVSGVSMAAPFSGASYLGSVDQGNAPSWADTASGIPDPFDLYPNASPGSLSSAANIAARQGVTPTQNPGDIAAADFLGTPEPEVNNAQLQPGATNEQPNIGTARSNPNVLLSMPPAGGGIAAAGNGDPVVGGGVVAGQTGEPGGATSLDAGLPATQQADTVGNAGNAGNVVGIAGNSSEVVLPDNTTLPAQWQVVDADQVKATLKEGKNQPRDRSRAASNVQVQGIANSPNFTLLRDSPVMDFGAPTISHDGSIVGGNGRFEGVSRAYDQGSAADYRAKLMADAASKGIDPASIEGMKKPVLVRRITQPFDTRALAIASNSGGSLQYSALEQAKIDGDRMQGIGDIEVNDVGDVALTGDNMANVRRALHGYTAAEMGSLTDKEGNLSQEGMRRFKNAMLYKAYGDSPVLSRLVESADNDLRNVSGALVRAAGTVAGVRADMNKGAISATEDIAAEIVQAVEILSKIKADGSTVDQFLAQDAIFGKDYNEATASMLRYMSDNIRSQKRMAEYIKAYYEALASMDTTTGAMFEETPYTKKERLSHAESKQSAEDAGQQARSDSGTVAQNDAQPENSKSHADSSSEGRPAEVDEAAKAKADADMQAALADLGAIVRNVAGVSRLTHEETQKLLPVLVRMFDAAFRKGYYDVKDAIKYVRGLLAENDATKKFAQFIPKDLMEGAASTAAKAMPDGFFDNQGMFAQEPQKAEVKQVERRDEAEARRRARYNTMSREQLVADLEIAHERERRAHDRERTSYLTGLPNRVAFDESIPMAFTASADIDGMKAVNEILGHPAGDSLIKAKADALRAAVLENPGVKVYHQSGDEFIAQANTEEEIDRAMKQAQKILYEKGFEYTDKAGNIQTKKGVGFSYGTGKSYAEADGRLDADKKQRKAAGLRTGERDAVISQAEAPGHGSGDAGNVAVPAKAVPNKGTDEAASVEPFNLQAQTNAEIAALEAAGREREADVQAGIRQRDNEASGRAQDDINARTTARANNPENFVFGESSKDAGKPMGNLFTQGTSSAPVVVEKQADIKQAEKQVDTNPEELAYSNSLKGRGDMDSAEDAFISAVQAVIAPAKNTSTALKLEDIPKTLKIADPSTGEGQYNARAAMLVANQQVEKLEALKRCMG